MQARTANQLLYWTPAIMLSLLAHAALVMTIQSGTAPDPVPMTEEIRTRIDMSSLDVPSQRAEAQQAEGELAEAGEASGERLGVREVPTSQARPVAPAGQQVAALAATTQVTRPSTAQGAATPATSASGARLAASAPAASSLVSTTAPTTAVVPAAIPSAVSVAAPAPRGDAIATLQPDSATLTAAITEAPSLAAAAPAPSAIAAAAPSADAMIATDSRGPVADAVSPPSVTMAAAVVPAETLPGAQATGTDLAPVAAATARLPTVIASAARVGPARPAATPAIARAADSTVLIATESAAPSVAAQRPPATSMAAAAMPAQALSGSRPTGTDLAPVAAETAALTTVAPAGARVTPAAPAAIPAVARAAEATAVVATVSTTPAVSARPAPAILMASVAAPAQSVATARAKSQQVASLRAAPEPVATLDSASPGIAAPAALAVPQATELTSSATSDLAGFVAPTSAASASVVASAALAWSGSANTVLDEQSLAAIQSFMAPGDIAGSTAHAGSVRDGIGAALAQFPCSRLQAAFLPDTGGLEIRGHVPTPEMKTAVVGMLEQSVGGAIPVGGSVLVLPNPQCGVLDAVERLGVPQSRDQIDDPLEIGEEAQARIDQKEDGARMTLTLEGADFDAHVYADFYDSDGNVVHMLPNEFQLENRFPAKEPFKIGDRESGLRMTVTAPFGQDIAVILATTTPLYDGARPLVERADDYLPWLHARVDALREADSDFRGEWAYIFVITGPVGAFAER